MPQASFLPAQAMPSAGISSTHTHKRTSWHSPTPAFYAAFYAGYEANGGSTR